jgi:methionyl-tRNA synthetase
MPENILIAIAWPYANAEIHVGNITGSHLPGDIVARYHRLKGNNVLMVSGTDSHGTPVTSPRTRKANPSRKCTNATTTDSSNCFKATASPTTCSPPPTPRIISRSRKPSSLP